MNNPHHIQMDLFCDPSPEVIERIKKSCDDKIRLNNMVKIDHIIRVSPMLINAYTKILLR